MNEFECEMTDGGDVLVRHVRQGHEFFVERGANDGGLTLARIVKGRSAIDSPELYTGSALAFAGRHEGGSGR